jgi:hypothetical protein
LFVLVSSEQNNETWHITFSVHLTFGVRSMNFSI